jgi:ATP synthase protein I
MAEDPLSQKVGAKERRKLRARRRPGAVWFGLGMIGLVGWSVAVPAVIGALLGAWLDGRFPGRHRWTLALLIAGLCLGCWNAGRWVAKEARALREEGEDDHG